MSINKAKPQHQVAYDDLAALLYKHAGALTPIELLAVAGNMVGKLVAMLDESTITPEIAMETVIQNMLVGNQQVIELLVKTMGTA